MGRGIVLARECFSVCEHAMFLGVFTCKLPIHSKRLDRSPNAMVSRQAGTLLDISPEGPDDTCSAGSEWWLGALCRKQAILGTV